MVSKTSNDELHKGFVAFFVVVHVLGIMGMWYAVMYASAATLVFACVYFFLAHLSITCAAHRLYSHAAFEASIGLQYVLVTLFSATYQGPIIWWAGKHRYHHTHEDREGDPHSPLDGFFHSHMGWLLYKSGWKPAPLKSMAHLISTRGMVKYSPASWQGRHYYILAIGMTFGVPLLWGLLVDDVWGGILVGGFTRLMFQYHFTWVVNSVGHRFGSRKNGFSTNVWILAVPTVGESFHANHHEFPGDFRLGRKWYQPDWGAFAIRIFALLGLAWNLQTPADTPLQ